MAEIKKMSAVEAEAEFKKVPERKQGKWSMLLKDLTGDGQGAKVTGLTRGSAYSLARQAKDKGFNARTTDKGTTVVISPKAKPKK